MTTPPAPSVASSVPAAHPRRKLVARVAAGIAVLVVGVTIAVVVRNDDDPVAGGVLLEPATEPGRHPFTESVAAPAVQALPAQDTTGTSGAEGLGPATMPGSTPGLYGGARGEAQCDRARLVDLLDADTEKSLVWAGAQDVRPDRTEEFILGLTSMQVRADTRVTSHGLRDGGSDAQGAVLEAGTAVLVDRQGIPRVRCASGNPLSAPAPEEGTPQFRGGGWAGFSPETVQEIEVEETIDLFVLTDLDAGDTFTRPPGTDGEADQGTDGSPAPDGPAAGPPGTDAPTDPPSVGDSGGTNDVDITLQWSGNDDLDLHVIEPGGQELSFSSPATAAGGNLVGGDDVPACQDTGDHTENAFWGAGSAPPGTYQVFVRNFGACDDDEAASFTLDLSVDGRSVGGDDGTLAPGRDSETVTFTVPR